MMICTLKMKLSGKESLLFDTKTNHYSNFFLRFGFKFCILFVIENYSAPEITINPALFGTI